MCYHTSCHLSVLCDAGGARLLDETHTVSPKERETTSANRWTVFPQSSWPDLIEELKRMRAVHRKRNASSDHGPDPDRPPTNQRAGRAGSGSSSAEAGRRRGRTPRRRSHRSSSRTRGSGGRTRRRRRPAGARPSAAPRRRGHSAIAAVISSTREGLAGRQANDGAGQHIRDELVLGDRDDRHLRARCAARSCSSSVGPTQTSTAASATGPTATAPASPPSRSRRASSGTSSLEPATASGRESSAPRRSSRSTERTASGRSFDAVGLLTRTAARSSACGSPAAGRSRGSS